MKKLVLVSAIAGAVAFTGARHVQAGHNCSHSQKGRCKVSGNKVPTSDTEFKALRARLPKDVFHAAALYVYALVAYADNPKLGEQLLLLASHESQLRKGGKVYKGWGWGGSMGFMMRMAKKYKYCFPGFASNATEANGKYDVDRSNVEVEIRVQTKYVPDPSTGSAKVWVCPINKMCFPLAFRQVHLKQDGQLVKAWKVAGASSAYTGCRYPKQPPKANPDL